MICSTFLDGVTSNYTHAMKSPIECLYLMSSILSCKNGWKVPRISIIWKQVWQKELVWLAQCRTSSIPETKPNLLSMVTSSSEPHKLCTVTANPTCKGQMHDFGWMHCTMAWPIDNLLTSKLLFDFLWQNNWWRNIPSESGRISFISLMLPLWAYGVVVSMFEFYCSDRGSNPGRGCKIS